MKKSLKVIYPLLGLFCIANCSDCNNFATPDCFGGNGDLDYPTFIRDFQQNCSKDFDNFIKYFGKPCVLKQVYPETKSQDVFKAFSETALGLGNKYQAYLFSKNDYELNDDEKAIKNKFKEEWNIQKKYQELLEQIKKTTNDTEKKALQKEPRRPWISFVTAVMLMMNVFAAFMLRSLYVLSLTVKSVLSKSFTAKVLTVI